MADVTETGPLTYWDEKGKKDVYAPEGMEYIPGTTQTRPRGSGGAAGTAPGSTGNTPYDQLLGALPSSLDFAKQVQGGIDATTAKYIEAMKARAKPMDLYNELETAQGLPQQRKAAQSLREQVYGLEDAIKRVEPTVAGTTRESMVTQAQRERMIAQQKEPMLENLGTISTNLGRIESSIASGEQVLAQKLALVMQGQEQDLEPFKVALQTQQDAAARLQTGFGEDKQTFLNVTLAKIKRGEELTDKERDEAFQLLTIEKNYQNQVSLMQKQSEINITQFLKEAGVNQKNAIELAKFGSTLKREEAKDQVGLNVEEAKQTLPLTLQEYEEKKKIDRKYPAPKSGGTDNSSAFDFLQDFLPGSPTSGAGATQSQGLSKPPMSSAPGTRAEYPQGSGIVWTMGTDGNWF